MPHLWTNDHALNQNTVNADRSWGLWMLQNNGGGTLKMIGRRLMSEVSFPSSKIATFDEADRHHARRQVCFLYDEARTPYLFFDGSVREYTTRDINPGCSPYRPWGEPTPWPVQLNYSEAPFLRYRMEPPDGDRSPVDFASTRFVSTRSGLHGVDVGGTQVGR